MQIQPILGYFWAIFGISHPAPLLDLGLPFLHILDPALLFNLGAMPLGDKAKAVWPLRAATLKQQAMITRQSGKAASGKAASGKLVWNQH